MKGSRVGAAAGAVVLAVGIGAAARAESDAAPARPAPTQAGQPAAEGSALPELPGDLPPAVRAYLEALQRRVAELERQVAQQKQPGQPGGVTPPGAPVQAGAPAPAAPAVQAPRGSRLQIGGFVQAQITNIASALGQRNTAAEVDFQLAKFRPRFVYTIDPHWEADFQINATTRSLTGAASLAGRDMYIEYRNAGYRMRMGQQKIPYGYEVFVERDEERIALERARVFNFIFSDARDIGLTVATEPRSPHAASFAAGVLNGNGINQVDNDTNKDVAATARVPLGNHHTLGLSAYSGTSSQAGEAGLVTTLKQAAGIDHQAHYGRVYTQLELLLGKYLGHRVSGGYGQLEYRFGVPGNLFARHDWFDPSDGPQRDYWRRTSLGWYKDFTRNIRLTLEYDWVTDELTPTQDNTYGLQVQGRF